MTTYTVLDLAAELHKPVDEMLAQLKKAGVAVENSSSPITHSDKLSLLYYLQAQAALHSPEKAHNLQSPLSIAESISETTISTPPETQTTRDDSTLYLIDGLNICRWGDRRNLSHFLGLILEFVRRRITFIGIFDANTGYILNDPVYNSLKRDFPDLIVEVPGKTPADVFLLTYADSKSARIVTNDQFRPYHHKYKWAQNDPSRLVKWAIIGNDLCIPDLDINTSVGEDTESLYAQFVLSMNGVKII